MSGGGTPTGSTRVWRNSLTVAGAGVALVAALFTLSFLFFDLLSPAPNPYVGLFTYLLFPGCIVVGVAVAVIGLVRTRRRLRRRYGNISRLHYYPRIDLNLREHQRVLAGVGVTMALALPLIGALSYEGYHYTDSNQFCGQVCHTVMQPQYTAHQSSPHARVDCAACHIGRGATWYLRSKLSGVRQLLAVALDSYPRPIPAGITELRPARETCEQCHWPEKFFGDQLVTIRSFAADERSTPRTVRMFVKTGGSDPRAGPLTGIHWHMGASHTIEFVAADAGLQDVLWVRATDGETGRVTVYRSDGKPASGSPPKGTFRTMDCMDCHNRAAHAFGTVGRSADVVLAADPVLRKLPFVKRELVAALSGPYDSREDGIEGVGRALRGAYEAGDGSAAVEREELLDRLVARAADTYGRTFFPDMRVDGRAYPDNIGHKVFPGCFRCHAGNHVDAEGEAIASACNTCHDFLAGTADEDGGALLVRGDFAHPLELEGAHAQLLCSRCHTGGAAPAATCEGCHADVAALRGASHPTLGPFGIAADAMDGVADCTSCHDLSASLAAVQERCLDCHDADGYGEMVAAWKGEYQALVDAIPPGRLEASQAVAEVLRRAGPWHNMEATRRVLRRLAEREPLPAAGAIPAGSAE